MKTLCIDARQIGQATGIGGYLRHLLPHLKAGPFRLHLLAPAQMKGDPLLDGCEHHPADMGIFSLKEQLGLPRAIPPCDIFWSPHFYVPLLPVRAKKRVVTMHDLFYLSPFARPPTAGVMKRFCYPQIAKFFMRAASRTASALITVSSFSAREIEEKLKVDPSRIHMIYNGADHLLPVTARPLTLPSKYLLFVGGADRYYKNLRGALETVETLRAQGEEISLVITGSQKVAKEPYVHYVGPVTDGELVTLYKGAFALLFPSFFEGFGLPPLEAMGLHCPVISSQAASLSEVVQDAASLIDPSSSASMARAVLRLKEERVRQEFIQKGIERASRFTWKRSAEEHLEAFLKVAAS